MTVGKRLTGIAAAVALAAATTLAQTPAFAEDGEISGEDGALLLGGLAALASLMYAAAKKNNDDQPASP